MCILGKSGCTGTKCRDCGWETGEIERRNRIFHTYGLTVGEDGLRRLVIGEKAVEDKGDG